MKKLIALLLALVMMIGLVACGDPNVETPEEPDNTLSAFYEGGAFASFSISSPEYNGYYYAGLNNVDEDVRWENYKKLDKWLWDNYMALPVCEVMKAVVYNDRIESFNQSALLRSCLGSLQIVGVE